MGDPQIRKLLDKENRFDKSQKVYTYISWRAKQLLFWNYHCSKIATPKVISSVPRNAEIHDKIVRTLKENSFKVKDFIIDIADYQSYLNRARYERFSEYAAKNGLTSLKNRWNTTLRLSC